MTITKKRLIYTAGTFDITDELAKCRRVVITMSVLRLPFSAKYVNERSNPRKYFFGYMTVFINEYVQYLVTLEYERQVLLLWDNPGVQLAISLFCATKQLSENLITHRESIPLTGTLTPVPGTPSPFIGSPFTNLKFKLEAGCRIQVVADGEEVYSCSGVIPTVTVPDLDPPAAPYPLTRPRSEDPPRSLPEAGELPGDTALASPSDPEIPAVVSGSWLLKYSNFSGADGSSTYTGVSSDTWAVVRPGVTCTSSGSSRLVKNATTVVTPNFNCNTANFISVLKSQVFTPGTAFKMSAIVSDDTHPGDG